MAKKRKSAAAGLEEVDRTMYSAFCTAANSLSQLYSHATNHQKLSFQAGERHALEKLYQWILKQQEEGASVADFDIIAYLQHELDYGIREPSMSPRPPQQQQQLPQQNPSIQVPYSELQTRNIFTNALSSPLRSSLQHYHLAQGNMEACNGTKHMDSNDSSMDMI
ncbi:hypothetical protein V2J09_009768 [Rumex salicifolius]